MLKIWPNNNMPSLRPNDVTYTYVMLGILLSGAMQLISSHAQLITASPHRQLQAIQVIKFNHLIEMML
jgi:hypothetical protein